MNDHTYVAIMAGGVGSRFWPASRASRPKQFLDILGTGKSLLQMTYARFRKLVPAERIFVVTNARYRELVAEQLPELAAGQILGEPSRNNTAPCVAYAAFKLRALDPLANLVVAPSDHLVLDEAGFLATLQQALAFTATHDALLTLGIQPTRPDTGYGYIRYNSPSDEASASAIRRVLSFTEKPPLEKAEAYLASGDYLWNAGIFVWRVEAVLAAFQQYAPAIYEILAAGTGCYNTDAEQPFIDEAYPRTPAISVDYAIMERADNVYTIPSDFGWSDLGTWASLHAVAGKDAAGNVVHSSGAILREVHNSLVRTPEGKLVVIGGLDDFIVVDEGDVLLIWPKAREQEIKGVTEELREGGYTDFL